MSATGKRWRDRWGAASGDVRCYRKINRRIPQYGHSPHLLQIERCNQQSNERCLRYQSRKRRGTAGWQPTGKSHLRCTIVSIWLTQRITGDHLEDNWPGQIGTQRNGNKIARSAALSEKTLCLQRHKMAHSVTPE